MGLGIMGGTFDPIHLGHLIVAEAARTKLELEEVVFVPTRDPWLKKGRYVSPAHHRSEMVRLAISHNPLFRVSTVEIDRPGPSYTVDTLEELGQELNDKANIYFILGGDSLAEVHQWRDPARVMQMCTLVAVPRSGHIDYQVKEMDRILPGASRQVIHLDTPLIDISGTDIRRRVAVGLSIKYLVQESVECYIHNNHLYKKVYADG